MNRIGKKILFVAFIMFGFIMGVRAESKTCTVEDKVRLRNLAAMVSVNYEMVYDYVEVTEDRTGYEAGSLMPVENLDVIIRNLSDEMYIILDSEYLAKKIVIDSSKKNEEGNIVIRKANLNNVEKMTFTVYSYRNCMNDKFRIINLTVPKINPFYSSMACVDVPEFYLCQPLITYDIGNIDYLKAIDEYAEKKANQESRPALENKTGGKGGAAGFINKYKYLIVGFVIAVGVALTVIVIKRRGSVVK